MRLNIQLFGGRGSSSTYGKEGYNTAGKNKKMTFYDKTNIYKGMTIQEFENRVAKFKSEYIGMADENGKILVAGTSFNHGAVAIPTTHPDFAKTSQMTHTHPIDKFRTLGGSLSGADVQNTALLTNLTTTRARAPEKTYIIRAKKGTKQDRRKLFAIATKSDAKWNKNAKTRITKIKNAFSKKGKKMSWRTEDRIYLGYGTKLWKNSLKDTGFEYIEIKRKYRR